MANEDADDIIEWLRQLLLDIKRCAAESGLADDCTERLEQNLSLVARFESLPRETRNSPHAIDALKRMKADILAMNQRIKNK